MEGRRPPEWQLKDLRKPFSLLWEKQREVLPP